MTVGESKNNREFGEYDSEVDESGEEFQQNGKRRGKPAEYEQIRQIARDRLSELAKPKEPKIQWHTCLWPRVNWCTQDMLNPISPHAKNGRASPRVRDLATPKKNFQEGLLMEDRPIYYYSAGRPSLIWNVSEGALLGSASQRVETLAKHKTHHSDWKEDRLQFFYSCGRSSPVWKVKEGKAPSEERQRTAELAKPRRLHPDFQPEKPVQTVISSAAKYAQASEHVQKLATPRPRPEGPFRPPQWPVSSSARAAVASTRCLELARAKTLPEGFQPAREIEWPVSKAAKRAQATERLTGLAQPNIRVNTDHVQYNPNAFKVKEFALKGSFPPHCLDLANPILR